MKKFYFLIGYWILLAIIVVLPSIIFLLLMEWGYFNPNCNVGDFNPKKVHVLLPNTEWKDLTPCSYYFDESEEYTKAFTCANKMWTIPLHQSLNIPRCFIVTKKSKDIQTTNNENYMSFPENSIWPFTLKIFGIYQPETKTIFIVENTDMEATYRHELQHYFLHKKYPWTCGSGHDQKIWKECEPPYHAVKFNPSFSLKNLLY